MLTTEIKRKIDSARDILVGKVPDPKAQVDQITNALIYKFMDDMDQEAIELGGKPQFFNNGYEKYAWSKVMDPKLGGLERLNLYVEAISKLSQNPHIPQLFRDIFKDAYLPYRDPETLSLFLKQINEFTYHHSEELGNSFEYLLSVLGSQGDAGQFRTPRHIIDFIVSVVAPKKTDRILDPACGTAGFLISAYKHIMASHDGKDETGKANEESRLTPDERKRLVNSIVGYDISPDMVKLSRVNMYLHGFPEPHISEYDTLSSEDNWDDNFDVILANPPFMSPKGGIRPHKRFSVQANRAEVLFVDYIAEHLTTSGRAGIIVPEGIIFQSGTAYKQLRKMLIDNGLWCVVSLPAGVFNPYAGVKTSILFIDRDLAKKFNHIMFINITSDGFDLGANRRPILQNDLPNALVLINECKKQINAGQVRPKDYFPFEDPEHTISVAPLSYSFEIVDRIRQEPDSTFHSSRYKAVEDLQNKKWPMVKLGDETLFRIESGGTPSSSQPDYWGGEIKWATLVDLPAKNLISEVNDTQRHITDIGLKNSSAKLMPAGTILVSSRATIGRIAITKSELATNQGFKNLIVQDNSKLIPKFIAYMLTGLVDKMIAMASGGTFKEISKNSFATLEIPLPPPEVQKEIVAELDGYQKILNAARTIAENYKPTIKIDPAWPKIKIGDTFKTSSGGTPSKSKPEYYINGTIPWLGSGEVGQGEISSAKNAITEAALKESSAKVFPTDSVLIAMYGATVGQVGILKFESATNQAVCAILPDKSKAEPRYIYYFMKGCRQKLIALSTGGAQPNISQQIIRNFEIPLPPIEKQQQIVEEMEAAANSVRWHREMISEYEQKIKDKIAEVWGE